MIHRSLLALGLFATASFLGCGSGSSLAVGNGSGEQSPGVDEQGVPPGDRQVTPPADPQTVPPLDPQQGGGLDFCDEACDVLAEKCGIPMDVCLEECDQQGIEQELHDALQQLSQCRSEYRGFLLCLVENLAQCGPEPMPQPVPENTRKAESPGNSSSYDIPEECNDSLDAVLECVGVPQMPPTPERHCSTEDQCAGCTDPCDACECTAELTGAGDCSQLCG